MALLMSLFVISIFLAVLLVMDLWMYGFIKVALIDSLALFIIMILITLALNGAVIFIAVSLLQDIAKL